MSNYDLHKAIIAQLVHIYFILAITAQLDPSTWNGLTRLKQVPATWKHAPVFSHRKKPFRLRVLHNKTEEMTGKIEPLVHRTKRLVFLLGW